jgi:mono/diheme cytochrome c family protein
VSLRRLADAVEALAAVAILVFVVLLFTNSPTSPPASPPEAVAAAGLDGADLYGQRCAGCHGGDGSGGIGPRLAGGRVVTKFPDPANQIAVVTNGRGGMPAFGSRLSGDEIEAIVEYTRTVLAEVQP